MKASDWRFLLFFFCCCCNFMGYCMFVWHLSHIILANVHVIERLSCILCLYCKCKVYVYCMILFFLSDLLKMFERGRFSCHWEKNVFFHQPMCFVVMAHIFILKLLSHIAITKIIFLFTFYYILKRVLFLQLLISVTVGKIYCLINYYIMLYWRVVFL